MPQTPFVDHVLSPIERDDVELLLSGLLARRQGYATRAQIATDSKLSRPALVVRTVLDPGAEVLLRDEEHLPVARLLVEDAWQDGVGCRVGGTVTAIGSGTPAATGPDEVAGRRPSNAHGPMFAVAADRPLLPIDVEEISRSITGERILLLPLVGHGRTPAPEALERSLQATASSAGWPRWEIRAVRLALHPEAPALAAIVAASLGADRLYAATAEPLEGTDEVTVLDGSRGRKQWADLQDDARVGRAPEQGALVSATAADVALLLPPTRTSGLVIFLTGLSGAGKSTVARAVRDRLVQERHRPVTLLDGDLVRRELSSGLGFNRADRDRNVRRIGWVAAEIARHGGTTVACPIAPYAATRGWVRRLVEEAGGRFVLVHVATPLAVCEERDPKGLYARARRGDIPAFTGISDPYEPPDDAEVVLDTSSTDLETCVSAVLDAVRVGGPSGRDR